MLRPLLVVILTMTLLTASAGAVTLTSPDYRLDPTIADSVGGTIGSTDYGLTDAGGEAAAGSGSSASYQLTSGYVSQLKQSLQMILQPTGIAAYYPLDTGQGTAIYDVSTNNNQGALIGVPNWTTGILNDGLSFNGSTQYASVPSSASLNLTGDMTISAWVNLSDYTVQHEVVSKQTGSGATNTTYELRVQQTTGDLQFLSYDTALETVTSTTQVPTGSWVQVAVIKKSGSVTLYLNGTAISNPTTIGTPTTNTNNLLLGANGSLANFLKGSLDEVKIYNRALPIAELQADVKAVNIGQSSAAAIPTVVPGVSQTIQQDIVVRTDAPGYNLSIAQNHNLLHTDGTTTIPSVGGSIAVPQTWSEGTTQGLGFTLTAGTNLEASWGISPNYAYAAIPTAATAFHSRTGFSAGSPDDTTMQYRLDAAASQKSGSYNNTVTITATLKP